MATAKLFDNLLFASQVHGDKLLANVEQFMSEEKQFRIANMRGKPEYVTINDGLPENDITRCKADYIISESAWHASSRQAAADELLETMTRMPLEFARHAQRQRLLGDGDGAAGTGAEGLALDDRFGCATDLHLPLNHFRPQKS